MVHIEDYAFEIVAEGLAFPEGPIVMPDGSILLVEIEARCVSRISPDGERKIVSQISGGPNGMAVGPDSALYICNNGGMAFEVMDSWNVPAGLSDDHKGGSINRLDLVTGDVTTVLTTAGGQPLIAPNDIVFDADGGFWFTDHGTRTNEALRLGSLCYARADSTDAVLVRPGLISPNGVGLSPDGATLYVADTWTGRLLSFEIVGPGEVKPAPIFQPGHVIATLPGFQLLDSLAVEADGRICVGTMVNGGITIFSPLGDFEHVALPDALVTNICFGGEDMRDVWITCSGTGTLRKGRWPRPGLKLHFSGN
jgi:gluconolactonase